MTTPAKPAGPVLPTKTDVTYDEALDSLTGHDEQMIADRFGINDIYQEFALGRTLKVGRALVTSVIARKLRSDDVKNPVEKAYNHVMNMTLAQVGDFWPDAAVDVDPDNPKSESGEGEPEPV